MWWKNWKKLHRLFKYHLYRRTTLNIKSASKRLSVVVRFHALQRTGPRHIGQRNARHNTGPVACSSHFQTRRLTNRHINPWFNRLSHHQHTVCSGVCHQCQCHQCNTCSFRSMVFRCDHQFIDRSVLVALLLFLACLSRCCHFDEIHVQPHQRSPLILIGSSALIVQRVFAKCAYFASL